MLETVTHKWRKSKDNWNIFIRNSFIWKWSMWNDHKNIANDDDVLVVFFSLKELTSPSFLSSQIERNETNDSKLETFTYFTCLIIISAVKPWPWQEKILYSNFIVLYFFLYFKWTMESYIWLVFQISFYLLPFRIAWFQGRITVFISRSVYTQQD